MNNKLCFKSFKHTNSGFTQSLYKLLKHLIMFAAATKSAKQRCHHHTGLVLPNQQNWLMGASRIQLFRLELPSPWLPVHHDNSQSYSMHLSEEKSFLCVALCASPLILRRVNRHNSKTMTTSTPDFFNVLSSRTVECSNNRSATETFLCEQQALL